ncbi:MAG: hypothetical protein KA436_09360 [Oligoflexales bacterium]|nr:hypothetical protein [Oligoflexales bacterium]
MRAWLQTWFAWFVFQWMKGLALCPSSFHKGLARILGFLRFRFKKKERHRILFNIEKIFKLPLHTPFARQFAEQVLFHQILCTLETAKTFFSPSLKENLLLGVPELRQNMAELEKEPGGQLVITAHLGAWELISAYGPSSASRPFYALAKSIKSEILNRTVAKLRSQTQVKILDSDSKQLAKFMHLSLREDNGWITFVMDQKPKERRGPLVKFLGQETPFVAGAAALAHRYHCPVLAVFFIREGDLRYRVHSKILWQRGHNADRQTLVASFASEIERMVRLYPEQWCWEYKRWKF